VRPVKELKGFKRVHLAPGQTQEISFRVDFNSLALYNPKMERVVEPGEFTIMVGPNSVDGKTCTLTVR
jgi:beta-glucosidase